MNDRKLCGIIGSGLIGTDPFAPTSWSGSSSFFFNKCKELGLLDTAIGFEVPKIKRALLMLRNFRLDKKLWRSIYYLDTLYYKALENEIKKSLNNIYGEYDFLQIGGIYNIKKIVQNDSRCYSYHDGNLAQMSKSPYFDTRIPTATFENALQFEKQVYYDLTHIFSMSNYLTNSFINDFGVSPSKVTTIGAGINLTKIPDIKYKSYSNKDIVFIGVDFTRKGGPTVVKAFKRLIKKFPKSKLHIIGPDKAKLSKYISDGIIAHGFLSKYNERDLEVIRGIFEKSSLFVMPSLYEPFGIAPLEAMVHGLPCILTNDWAFPEMITPGKNGDLVEVNNVEELTEKMINLLSDPSLLEEMGMNGRNLVLENYTWDIVVKKMKNVMDNY